MTEPSVRRFVRFTYAGSAAVLLATLGLWAPWPTGETVMTTGTADEVVTLTISSPHTAHIILTDRQRTTAAKVVTVQAVLPTAGYATPATIAPPTGDGHYRAPAVELMMPGRWELVVDVSGSAHRDRLVLPLTISN